MPRDTGMPVGVGEGRRTASGRPSLLPMNRRQLFATTFMLCFLFLLWELIRVVSPFFSPIVWAVILATATYPAYLWILRICRGRDSLAAAIMTLVVLLAVVLPALYGTIMAGQQAMELYEQESEWIRGGHLKDIGEWLTKLPGIGPYIQELIGRIVVANSGTVEQSLLEGGKKVSAFVLERGVDLATNTVLVVTDFVVMLFTLFFMFRDGEVAYGKLYRAIPLEEEHKRTIFDRLTTTMKAVVRGTLLTAIAQGIVAGLGYYLLDIPYAVFLGLLSAVLSFLPIGGTALVWVPIALYLLLTGSVLKGLILVGIGAGLVGLMDNLLQPLLVGAEAGLPVLPLFFASLGGLAAYGFLGLFLGPILLSLVLETFRIYQEDYQQEPGLDLIVTPGTDPPVSYVNKDISNGAIVQP